MNQRLLNGDDIQMLNEQIMSQDRHVADLARQRLFESVNCPECFADSTSEEWARRIVKRIKRTLHS